MIIDTKNLMTYAKKARIRNYPGRGAFEAPISADWCEKNGVVHGDKFLMHQIPGEPRYLLIELTGNNAKE